MSWNQGFGAWGALATEEEKAQGGVFHDLKGEGDNVSCVVHHHIDVRTLVWDGSRNVPYDPQAHRGARPRKRYTFTIFPTNGNEWKLLSGNYSMFKAVTGLARKGVNMADTVINIERTGIAKDTAYTAISIGSISADLLEKVSAADPVDSTELLDSLQEKGQEQQPQQAQGGGWGAQKPAQAQGGGWGVPGADARVTTEQAQQLHHGLQSIGRAEAQELMRRYGVSRVSELLAHKFYDLKADIDAILLPDGDSVPF